MQGHKYVLPSVTFDPSELLTDHDITCGFVMQFIDR